MLSLILSTLILTQPFQFEAPLPMPDDLFRLKRQTEYPPEIEDVDRFADVPNLYIRYYTPSGTLVIEAIRLNGKDVRPKTKIIDIVQ
jgi:hypothetical protein